MIVESKKKINIFSSSLFQQIYFEADGEEDDKNNITVKTNSSRGTDYDAGDEVKVRPGNDGGTDYDTTEDDNTDAGGTSDEENTTTDDNTGGGEESGGTDYDADDGTDGDEGADGDTEDDTNTDDDTTEDDNESEDKFNPLDTKNDAKKKFSMYQRYITLYKNVDIYNDRIQNTVKDEPIANTVLKTVSRNFSDLKDNMYDFMTIKFQKADYIQILTFFETCLAIIKLNFELLRNNKINLKQ